MSYHRKISFTPKATIQWGQAICTAIVPFIVLYIYITGREIKTEDITVITTLLGMSAAAQGWLRFVDSKAKDNEDQPEKRQ